MDGWINKNPEATKYPGHYLRPFNIVYMSVRLLYALCRWEGYYFESILLKRDQRNRPLIIRRSTSSSVAYQGLPRLKRITLGVTSSASPVAAG